jgi:hypothetical protein
VPNNYKLPDSSNVMSGNEMDESSEFARDAILEVVENQIKDDYPREVKQTFHRLLSEGHSKEKTMKLIASAVCIEIFGIMKYKTPFNESRYIKNLSRLPEIPLEEIDAK